MNENTEDYDYRWGIMGIYGDIGWKVVKYHVNTPSKWVIY